MSLPQRRPPGPIKRFNKFFTVPITREIHEAMETLKWRTRLDKTEVLRRLLEYFLTLPADSQDTLLRSFDGIRQKEMETLREKTGRVRKVKQETPTYVRESPHDPVTPVTNREIKRSGLP